MNRKSGGAPDRGIEVVDERGRDFFVVDNAAIDALNLSVFVKMTYMVLVRHLDGSREWCPSADLMARQAGISVRQVLQSIHELEARRMISIKRRRSAPDECWLLDKSLWQTGALPGQFSPSEVGRGRGRLKKRRAAPAGVLLPFRAQEGAL
jgi:hypothetical protein